MRIALVCPYDWSVEGGVRTHARQLSQRFREWGHAVTVYAPASDPEAADGEVMVMGTPHRVPALGSVARITFSWLYRQVRAELRKSQFDIVHLHEPLAPLLPYFFLRHSNAINIGTFHAAYEGRHMYGYTRPLTRRWFDKLHGRIAVSPAARRLVSAYFPGEFTIIPNGIDFEFWARPREPWPEFQDGKKNILFVGRPEKRKGLDYLLRAYLMLRKRREDIRLIVAGAGDFSRYQEKLAGYDDIVFRPNVPYDELPRYHYTADVMCCPNTGGESQGYVLMEALATGRAVVASDIEGFAGVVTDGEHGVLVPPRSAARLAGAINELLDDEKRRRELGTRGRERASEYSWETVAARVLEYYRQVMSEPSVPEGGRQRLRQSVSQ